MSVLRLRSMKIAIPEPPKPIGEIDYIDLTHGHKSFLSSPIKVMGNTGLYADVITFDENHGVREAYEVGGPFFQRRTNYPNTVEAGGIYRSITGQPPHGAATRPDCGGTWCVEYRGGFTNNYSFWSGGAPAGEAIKSPTDYDGFSNKNDLSNLGNRGYGKLRPKLSGPKILQSIVELRDMPRTLKTSVKAASDTLRNLAGNRGGWDVGGLKKSGDAFLTYQFGWKPFVDDIVKVCDTVINADEYFRRIRDGNNRWRKREFHEDDVVSESVIWSQTGLNHNSALPFLDSGSGWVVPGSGSLRTLNQKVTRVWYAGSFKYYRPEFGDHLSGAGGDPLGALNDIRRWATALGGNLSATMVYKVMPWTWLGDWLINASDFVQRSEDLANHGVVSKYLYLMRETVDRFVINPSCILLTGPSLNLRFIREVIVKRRIGSNSPFNFSLLPSGGLSEVQLAILAALGLSHRG